MKPKTKSNTQITFNYKGIELINSELLFQEVPLEQLEIFNFNLNINININPDLKLVVLDVNVNIFTKDMNVKMGSIVVRNIFEIINFAEIVKLNNDSFEILPEISKTLQIISIGTTRGMMFSTFKGTFLHGALLPLFDPASFKSEFIFNKDPNMNIKKVRRNVK